MTTEIKKTQIPKGPTGQKDSNDWALDKPGQLRSVIEEVASQDPVTPPVSPAPPLAAYCQDFEQEGVPEDEPQQAPGLQPVGLQPVSARDLYGKKFDPLHWIVQDIIPAGTMLLFGKPKKGKSFLTLLIAISVAAGRPVFGKPSNRSTVLYLGLEDSERRAQRRLKGCANALNVPPDDFIDRLHFSTSSKRIDTGLIDELHAWMEDHPDTGLIVVDMLKKVTGASTGKSLYDEQAEVGHALTTLSHSYPSLAIVVVHHARKADSEDPFDLVSGTTGLSGSYDSLAAIIESIGARHLCLTGRDIEDSDIPLLMGESGMYTLEQVTPEQQRTHGMSNTRRKVYDAIPSNYEATRKDIISTSQLDENVVDQQLRKLVKDGLVSKHGRGQYRKTSIAFFEEVGASVLGVL